MHKAIILAAGLALIGTSALGQSSWRGDRDDDRRDWREDRRDNRDREDTRGRSTRDHSMRDHHDDDDKGQSRAARFVLRSGDARMAVRCDDRESMRACVDAALTMFDRIRTQQGTASGSTSTAPSTAPASPAPSSPTPSR